MSSKSHAYLRRGLPLAVLAALVLVVSTVAHGALTPYASSAGAAAPTIRSDKDDYTPGETVTLSGANWQPSESVHILVNDDKGQSWSRNVDVVAADDGTIEDRFQLPDWFIAAYSVTATGPVSGTATTSFTDGNVKVLSAAGRHFDYQVTLYSSTNCTTGPGTAVTKTADVNGSTSGVGSNESLLIVANTNANAPNATATFSHWTFPGLTGGAARGRLHGDRPHDLRRRLPERQPRPRGQLRRRAGEQRSDSRRQQCLGHGQRGPDRREQRYVLGCERR